jgi:hypothetical protein
MLCVLFRGVLSCKHFRIFGRKIKGYTAFMELHRYVETEYSAKNGFIASLLTKNLILLGFSPRQRRGILNLMIRSFVQAEGSYDRYPAPPKRVLRRQRYCFTFQFLVPSLFLKVIIAAYYFFLVFPSLLTFLYRSVTTCFRKAVPNAKSLT